MQSMSDIRAAALMTCPHAEVLPAPAVALAAQKSQRWLLDTGERGNWRPWFSLHLHMIMYACTCLVTGV